MKETVINVVNTFTTLITVSFIPPRIRDKKDYEIDF